MLFNILTNYLDETKCTFIRFINMRECSQHTERQCCHSEDLNRVEEQANKNLMKFTKHNRKVLYLRQNTSLHWYRMVANFPEDSSAGKELQIWQSA